MITLKEGTYVAPAIKIIENAIENCEELIEIAKGVNDWTPAGVGGNNQIESTIRNCKKLGMPVSFDSPKEWFELAQKINAYGQQYAAEADIPFGEMEQMQMLHYQAGDGFYQPHYDNMPASPRDFSAVLYLNDVEDGGETVFLNFDIGVKPIKGNLILFPANFAFIHEAITPRSEDKFAVVTWFKSVVDRSSSRKCKC